MQKLLLLSICLLLSAQVFGQDPALFKTWDLYQIEIKFSQGVLISDVEPAITPKLTIDSSLAFSGFGACNSFSGSFLYLTNEDKLDPIDYMDTSLDCETQFLDAIEDEYFGYFKASSSPLFYTIFIGNDGLEHLIVSAGSPGFQLEFINPLLSVTPFKKSKISVYPNPVLDQLFITSESLQAKSLAIYSISGQRILSEKNNANTVDVSELSKGVYFLEITSLDGTSVQKFVKE